MPYKDPDKARQASKLAMRKYRAKKQATSHEWKLSEKERKAEWYANNKEKKAEAQRIYRKKLKDGKSSH